MFRLIVIMVLASGLLTAVAASPCEASILVGEGADVVCNDSSAVNASAVWSANSDEMPHRVQSFGSGGMSAPREGWCLRRALKPAGPYTH